jgi:pyrimidine deaminase RibD-like protein/predicted nucleic acid-binding protein
MNGHRKVLLDTDTLSLYLRKSPNVIAEAQRYLQSHRIFSLSIITRFEILRGMMVRNASAQLQVFNLFCQQNEIFELDDNIIIRASEVYADLHKRGQLVGDADILIAATAIENGLPVVTNNESHFNRISSLEVLNWNK